MKVKELMEMLKSMDENTEIRFRDTYWENEGYGDRAKDPRLLTRPTYGVNVVDMKDGESAVVIY